MAGLGEPKKGIAAIAPRVAAGSAADLAAGDVAADVVLGAIGVQRDLRPLQHHQQQEARHEIITTLNAYETTNRAELLLAAQVIALGMTTLDALAEAKSPETPPALRIRHRGNANSLNRSATQTEKTLYRSRATPPAQAPHNHLWAGAMLDTLKQMGIPAPTQADKTDP